MMSTAELVRDNYIIKCAKKIRLENELGIYSQIRKRFDPRFGFSMHYTIQNELRN